LLQPGSPAHAATHTVAVGNNFFNSASITVDVGDTVEWDWPAAPNAIPHSVTSDSGTLLSSPVQATGTYSKTFDTPGTYTYHCEVHPTEMTGTVIVQAAQAQPTSTTAAATETPAATRTPVAATRTPTAAATATSAPAATATTPSLIAPAATATPAGAAGPGQALPSTGDGGTTGGGGLPWAGVLLGLAAVVVVLGGAAAVRRRG
jgi:plastocyanin